MLVLARSEFFRAFGPGMAATIAIGWLVVITLAPALLAIFGPVLFWPSSRRQAGAGLGRRRALLVVIVRHPLPAVLGVVAVLGVGAFGLTRLGLANPVIRGLPAGADAQAGYRQLSAGFGAGFAAPTLVVVRGSGLQTRRAAVERLQHSIAARPGVAAVVGPGDSPLAGHVIFMSGDGRTARLAVVPDGDPLGAAEIAWLRRLRDDMQGLLQGAGLDGSHGLVGGDSAVAADPSRSPPAIWRGSHPLSCSSSRCCSACSCARSSSRS